MTRRWIFLLATLAALGCGAPASDPAPEPRAVVPEVPAVVPERAEEPRATRPETPTMPGTAQANEADAPESPGPELDLLHAVPSAIAVSSAYRSSLEQVGHLVDGDLSSAWNSESGDLVGAWIALRFPEDVSVVAFELGAGFARETEARDLFTSNHRITRVRITHEDTARELALDPSVRAPQRLPFEGGGGDYRIEVLAVQAGTREDWRETCVSELRVIGRAASARPGRRRLLTAVGALPALPPAEGLGSEPESEPSASELPEPIPSVYFITWCGSDPCIAQLREDGEPRVVFRGTQGLSASRDGRRLRLLQQRRIRPLAGGGSSAELPAALSGAGQIRVGPFGETWALAARSVGRFQGGSWRVTDLEAFDGRGPLDLTFDPGGRALVLTSDAVFQEVGEGWARLPLEAERLERFADDQAGVIVRHRGGFHRLVEGAWVPIDGGPWNAAAARADGTLVLIPPRPETLTVRPPQGPPRTLPLPRRFGYLGALHFDASGRLWSAGREGVVVLDRALERVEVFYPSGTLPHVASVQRFVTLGALASLPAPEPERGHVVGRLLHQGQPLANRRVVFCRDPERGDLGSMGDPCELDESPGAGATTRPDGSFELFRAPQASLYLVVFPPGARRFYISPEPLCCGEQRPGETLDLGDVVIP